MSARETKPVSFPRLNDYKPTRSCFRVPITMPVKRTVLSGSLRTSATPRAGGAGNILVAALAGTDHPRCVRHRERGRHTAVPNSLFEIPKKNGKSELAAAVALYLLYADNEPSAEVYGARRTVSSIHRIRCGQTNGGNDSGAPEALEDHGGHQAAGQLFQRGILSGAVRRGRN